MTALVDTSAIFALLDADDRNHLAATAWFDGPGRQEPLMSHSYVVVEAAALVHRRLGAGAARALFDSFLPALNIVYVDEDLHASAVRAWLGVGTHGSLIDWASFEVMRRHGIDRAFVFDEDFRAQGITVLPEA